MLAVARALLGDVGPLALTYSLLAEQAGVTRQTLYRHWPTREALLADIILAGKADRALASLAPGADPQAVAAAFLRQLRDGLADRGIGGALMMLAAQADRDADSAQALVRITTERRRVLNQWLAPCGVQVTVEQFAQLVGPVVFCRFLARGDVVDSYLDAVVAHWFVAMGLGASGASAASSTPPTI